MGFDGPAQAAASDLNEHQRVVEHLMKSLELWRASERIMEDLSGKGDHAALSEEEKELLHSYDLLQVTIARIEKR